MELQAVIPQALSSSHYATSAEDEFIACCSELSKGFLREALGGCFCIAGCQFLQSFSARIGMDYLISMRLSG